MLDQISYGPAFEVIVTAEETERHKPDPDPILLALERLRVGPDAAIYVGDSPYDILAARAAGVASGGGDVGHPRARRPARAVARPRVRTPLQVLAA